MKQTNIFDFLIESLSDTINAIVDKRKQRSNLKYTLHDIVLSAFSVFYFQNKSWLSFQRDVQTTKGLSNAQTMFGIKEIPSEINASKRWIDNFDNQTNKKLIILGDDLYSREPRIQKVLDNQYSYIFVAKPTSHKYLYEQIDMVRNLGTCDTKRVEKMVKNR